MYNLTPNSKETVQFPMLIKVADDNQCLNDLLNHKASSINDSVDMSDSQESSDSDIDCDALVRDSDSEIQSMSGQNVIQNNPCHNSKIDSSAFSLDFKIQSVINSQISQQLQQIGKRLDKVLILI